MPTTSEVSQRRLADLLLCLFVEEGPRTRTGRETRSGTRPGRKMGGGSYVEERIVKTVRGRPTPRKCCAANKYARTNENFTETLPLPVVERR